MIEKLVNMALILPAEIEKTVLKLATEKQSLHDVLAVKQKLEAEIAGEVASETTPDGKKKYPNEEARKAEIARRLAEDDGYRATDDYLRAVREEVTRLEAHLERLRLEHKTAVALLSALGNESLATVLREHTAPGM